MIAAARKPQVSALADGSACSSIGPGLAALRRPRAGRAPGARAARRAAAASAVEPPALVLVAGATGGVGQLATAKLLDRGYRVRAMSRSADKARALLGENARLEVVQADLLGPRAALEAAAAGASAVICATGTTAFPSKRWDASAGTKNDPQHTDYEGVRALVAAVAQGGAAKRFVLLTSAGVERFDRLPFSILNLFGVLKYKRMAEEELAASGLPFVILRPGRLTDGPYTSYDVNTLLGGIAGTRQAVTLSAADDLDGETSRIAVAEAAVQALLLGGVENRAFAITSVEGEGPGTDAAKWRALFEGVPARA